MSVPFSSKSIPAESSVMPVKWTDARIRRLVIPGLYGVGDGLYVHVQSARRRSWIFRYRRAGQRRDMGLGVTELVDLAEAKAAALACRRLLARGGDPIEQRRAERRQALIASAKAKSWNECVAAYFAAYEPGWTADHARKRAAALATYAAPVFDVLPVDAVDTQLVLRVLRPIWSDKSALAAKLRGWIEAIIDFSTVHGYRDQTPNPARWKGHLERLLPNPNRVAPVEHQMALPWREVPAFMSVLQAHDGAAARAMQLIVLTAARKREVLGMVWGEIDLARRVWVIPARRMKKGRREHRVALSEAAVGLLEETRRRCGGHPLPSTVVFPSPSRPGRPLRPSAPQMLLRRLGFNDRTTVHGFRSSFSDFTTEGTKASIEVRELALAHAVGDQVIQADMRSDLFEQRRALSEAWANFVTGRPVDPAILIDGALPIRRATASEKQRAPRSKCDESVARWRRP
jgi:integrase